MNCKDRQMDVRKNTLLKRVRVSVFYFPSNYKKQNVMTFDCQINNILHNHVLGAMER